MKFTEEQIEAILDCIENASVELYKDEWEEIQRHADSFIYSYKELIR